MLTQRIICKLLLENGQLVKYKNFTESRRLAGDPVATMGTLEDQKLDEFYLCDTGVIDPELVARMTERVFAPVTAAGSIKTMAQVDDLIRNSGVDKVVVHPSIGQAVAEKYGRQAVVYTIDYGGDAPFFEIPDWAGEVILTSVDRDGCGGGFDLGALRFPYEIPVVVAGGCGKLAHVRDAFAAGASGCAVSSMFFFSDKSPIKLRSWLLSEGCNVRAA